MTNSLTYVPKFEDFGDYRLKQDSAVELPLGLSDFWKLRLGVSNAYKSFIPVDSELEKLDTTYYTRLILSWE